MKDSKNLSTYSQDELNSFLAITNVVAALNVPESAIDAAAFQADSANDNDAERQAREYAKKVNAGRRVIHSTGKETDEEKGIVAGVRDWMRRRKNGKPQV